MAYIKETCVTGRIKEIRKVVSYRYGKRSQRRKGKLHPTPEGVQKNNERYAEMKLRRILNANFHGGKDADLYLTMTYSGEAPSPEEAKKRIRKFLRKAREQAKKEGKDLKYVTVTEFEAKRIHHHIVISRIDIDVVQAIWPYGLLDIKLMDASGQYAKLANYLIKETSRTFKKLEGAGGKRWNQSKNLKPYDHLKKEIVSAREWRKEPKAEKGYAIEKDKTEEGVFERDGWIIPYQFYSMIEIGEEEKTWTEKKTRSCRRKDRGKNMRKEKGRGFA